MAGGLLVFLATQYAPALTVPFINDDFVFIDKARKSGFGDLWRPENLPFHWYRPWSRELHYWVLDRLFGARELPFHLVSFALWLGVLLGFWALARRVAGTRAAAVAVAGVAALAAWGVPLLWVAGVQELWMLLFSVLTLHAWIAGRRGLATAALLLALLSKETAVVLAPIAVLGGAQLGDRRALAEVRRAWPLLAVTALWAAVHPVLGGRIWHPLPAPLEPGAAGPGLAGLWRTPAVAFNLDVVPRPEHGWAAALLAGAVGALALGAIAMGARAARSERRARPIGPGARLGATWALLGWAPLLMPTLGWHAYYALLGCFGLWLALGVILARRPWAAVALVSVLAVVRPARADTPSLDWGSEWYQRRAAEFMRVMRSQLLATRPRLEPHARVYFIRVPSNVGFIAGDGPALRVWYGDSTLRAGFYSTYRPRRPAEPPGPDHFFRFDSTGGWVEVTAGPEGVPDARRANPRWERDHATLAATFAQAGDWGRAAAEYAKLADAVPSRADYAHDAGVCAEALGDSSGAAAWYARAASLPGADDEIRAAAGRMRRHLRAVR